MESVLWAGIIFQRDALRAGYSVLWVILQEEVPTVLLLNPFRAWANKKPYNSVALSGPVQREDGELPSLLRRQWVTSLSWLVQSWENLWHQMSIISFNDYNNQFIIKKMIQVPSVPFITFSNLWNLSLSFLTYEIGILLHVA